MCLTHCLDEGVCPFDCRAQIYFAVLTCACGMSPLLLECENMYTDGGHRVYHVQRKFPANLPPAREVQPGSAPNRIVEAEFLPPPLMVVIVFCERTYV